MQERNQSIDGIRGFAILAVILYHLLPDAFPGGFIWVNIFFVLSGYFFVRGYERMETTDFKDNLQRLLRSLSRLFQPLFWFLVLLVVGLLFFAPQELNYLRSDLWSSLTFTNNLYQIQADRSYFAQMTDISPLTHLWYNALLVQVMGLSFLVIYGTRRLSLSRSAKVITWLVIAFVSQALTYWLYQPGADPSRIYYGVDTRWLSFAVGIIAYYIKPWVDDRLDRMTHPYELVSLVGAGALAFLLGLTLLAEDTSASTYQLWLPWVSWLGLYLLLTAFYQALPLAFVFDHGPLAALGRRSYSFYLWYYPVLTFYARHLRWFQGRVWLYVLVSLGTILVLSWSFYEVFEAQRWTLPWRDLPSTWRQPRVLGQILALTLILGIFTYGLLTSRQDKRPALFSNEYQEFQLSTNIQGSPHPDEAPIQAVKERMQDLDDWLGLAWESQAESPAALGLLGRPLLDPLASDSDQNFANEDVQAVQAFREWYPVPSQYLTDEEIHFALSTPVTFFGDSLTLLNTWYFNEVMPESRSFGYKSLQIWDATDILQDLLAEDQIVGPLVINLGTNAGLERPIVEELVNLVPDDRPIYFVNTHSAVMHQQSVNEILAWAEETLDNVTTIDWYQRALGHPEYYDGDDIHLSLTGMEYQAVLIIQTLYQDLH